MQKDFDSWNKRKQELDTHKINLFAHPREIWWCSLGINIGAETDGKNENFERAVIVMKVYNTETLFVLPVTTKQKNNKFHHKIVTEQKIGWVKLTQSRVISSKRLLRKVDVLSEKEFEMLKNIWKESI
ncbi:MAG: type II toxin-antitoxin system PemK/MazF family toxin [Candidatus Zambryskibacteria bacterium]|nr:type II toxin-antitoxin system PemK/MazF family toxin [Candidatus Zambryskibacteria bacterium]